ncbi:Cytochrome c-type biogenesis protein CcmE [invertebrate metagenome]|uniref:Cytochrome c-type biogenesis protein CcmE n=1 Tax=invertebrate metagenome TaxID=1711999 RepID=A0A2H9TA72_9ZZZZ
MSTVHRQRLWLLALLFIGAGITATLILFALKENINHYFSPTQIVQGAAPLNTAIRGGGLVVHGSIIRDPKSLLVSFKITDGKQTINVLYDGILPDLFTEGQGVVATGHIDQKQRFIADTLLAKHNETYMPPEVKKSLQSNLNNNDALLDQEVSSDS